MQKQNKYTIASVQAIHPYLQYFTQFHSIPNRLAKMEDFADGVFLIEFARLIEGFQLESDVFDIPRTLQQRYANLKNLFRSIETYWNKNLETEIEGEEIRLVEIARNGNT